MQGQRVTDLGRGVLEGRGGGVKGQRWAEYSPILLV